MSDGLCECGCGFLTPIAKRNRSECGWVKGEHIRYIHGHHRRGAKHSSETLEKMSIAKSGENHHYYGITGEQNPYWKGGKRLSRRKSESKRRAQIRNTLIEDVDYLLIRVRDNSICYICGVITVDRINPKKYQPDEIHFEHIVALSNGGSHTYENIKVSCGRCNLKKGHWR